MVVAVAATVAARGRARRGGLGATELRLPVPEACRKPISDSWKETERAEACSGRECLGGRSLGSEQKRWGGGISMLGAWASFENTNLCVSGCLELFEFTLALLQLCPLFGIRPLSCRARLHAVPPSTANSE